jgi:positive regulator of sigma E activity
MRTKAYVVELNGTRATVEIERASACEGCHKQAEGGSCSVCTLMGGENQRHRAVAENSLGARVGDTVYVESPTAKVLGYAFLVFVLPVLLAMIGYGIAAIVSEKDPIRLLGALIGFAGAFVGLRIYSATIAKKRVDVVITEILTSEQ